jgi:hypothetical protein
MRPWKILRKEITRLDSENVELHLYVLRDGVHRDAIVSGRTYDEKQVGDEVELSEGR